MNIPNILTLFRVALIPFFIFMLMMPSIPHSFLWALLIFALASVTDFFDGFLARKLNLITNFGKFLDPLADKLLVCSALVCFIELQFLSSVAVFIIIAREFMVTSIRLVAQNTQGKVIAASFSGKLKTVVQMLLIILALAFAQLDYLKILEFASVKIYLDITLWLTVFITLFSGIEILIKNWSSISFKK